MNHFNQRVHAFLLYLMINDVKCQRLIEKYNIPRRGARISVQDLEMLIAERPGGKESLILEHPWMRAGYPILVNTLSGKRIFGFKEVDEELERYHYYLDTYHASLQESKLPGAAGPGWGGHPSSQYPNERPAQLIATRQPQAQPQPHGQPHGYTQPQGYGSLAQPPTPITPAALPPVKSESKKLASMPVAPPPPQDPLKPAILVPEPFDFTKFVVTESKSKPSEPLLSQQVKLLNGSVPPGGVVPASIQPEEHVEQGPVEYVEQVVPQPVELDPEPIPVPQPIVPVTKAVVPRSARQSGAGALFKQTGIVRGLSGNPSDIPRVITYNVPTN